MDARQAQKIAESYLQKLGLTPTGEPIVDSMVGTRSDGKQEPYWQLRFPDAQGTIWLNLRVERLTSLSRTTRDGKRALYLPGTPVSEAHRQQRAKKIVEALGLVSEYPQIPPFEYYEQVQQEGWSTTIGRRAHGLPFSGQGLSIALTAAGDVLSFSHPTYTPVPLAPPKRNVSPAQALAIAESCIRRYGLATVLPSVGTVEKNLFLVAPDTFWEPSNWGERFAKSTFPHGSPDSRDDTTRAAWIIPCRVLADESRLFYGAKHSIYSVYVDIETGAVIGGWHGPHLSPQLTLP